MFFVLLKSPTLGIVGVIVAKINMLRNWNNWLKSQTKLIFLKRFLFNSRSFKRKLRFNFKLELTDFFKFDHCPISAIAVPSFKR